MITITFEVVMGIFNPARYGIAEHCGYDITKLHDNYRSIKLLKNRDDFENRVINLFFDGACDYFRELPSIKDKEKLTNVYKYAQQLAESRRRTNG
jgi:hypothetical protein